MMGPYLYGVLSYCYVTLALDSYPEAIQIFDILEGGGTSRVARNRTKWTNTIIPPMINVLTFITGVITIRYSSGNSN